MYNDKRLAIFVHINKCAGSSIRDAIKNEPNIIWCVARESLNDGEISRNDIIENVWKQAFKFCFVRNPWDRIVSSWNMFCSGESENCYKKGMLFRDFVYLIKDLDVENNQIKYQNNKKFLQSIDNVTHHCSSYFNEKYFIKDMNFIGRFECLQDHFNIIYKKLNLKSAKLPYKNRLTHRPYWEYYSDETRKIVYQKYLRDIEYFNYQFR